MVLQYSSHSLYPPLELQTPKPLRKVLNGAPNFHVDLRSESEHQTLKHPPELSHNKRKHRSSTPISPYSYLHLLQSCSDETTLRVTLQLHAHIVKSHFRSDLQLQTSIVNLYIRCNRLDSACRVFEASNLRNNLVSLNSIITAYCRDGFMEEALTMFLMLQKSGLAPDEFTLSVLIAGVEEHGELSLGRQLHSLSIKLGHKEDEFVTSSLIRMYACFSKIDDSLSVFKGVLDSASVVTWNSMIAQLAENELYLDSLKLYRDMQIMGIKPTPSTLSSVVKVCSTLEAGSAGKQVHTQVIVRGFVPNVILETALVDFYSKCGMIEDGRLLFEKMVNRNVFTWNSMIRGYSQLGHRKAALQIFGKMRREEIAPDKFTYPALFSAARDAEGCSFPEEFRSIHANVLKLGLQTDKFIGSSLIAMYSRKQSVDEARLAFQDTDSKDIGVWSSVISANAKNEESEEALRLFTEMVQLSIEPNPSIFSSLFMVSCDLSAIESGKQIHGYSLKNINFLDTAAQNSLLTMYSDSGLLTEAQRVFDSMAEPNVESFNSMISGLAQHGLPCEAYKLLERMRIIGLKPDRITLLNLLSAFNHAGLVDKGLQLFYSMEMDYEIEPRYQHYACIVDMLARAGEIKRATALINEMPFESEPSLLRVVLGACSKHRNLHLGRPIAEKLIHLEPQEAANYVLIANVHARVGRWEEAEKIRNLMEARCAKKEQGVSWLEVKKKIYKFGVEDKSHPLSEEIYSKLEELMREIKAVGYEPDMSFTLHEMEYERREESLWYHGEKLAFAFGVLSTDEGVKLRIMKNLRVCGDCHSAFKYFSLITGREILLKDKYRFHHFSCGVCSCGDYW